MSMDIQEQHAPIAIRCDVKPGDIGYITHLHGILYAKEYGLDCTFEGYVAESLARFALSFDARKNRLWLAERDGRIVGSIGIVGLTTSEAQLRWFLVHPTCRGGGLGYSLLKAALQFCRDHEFTSVFLWTFSELQAAAHLYRAVGFQKTEQKRHVIWGHLLTEERYDLPLQGTTEHAWH
jgi:N-acetylglutamate synthase-like GNAT family acetyltransferase